MSALYRRYRPQDFDEVVGQGHVVRTLRSAIDTDRVAHAYLFAGPRGTGKTSLAKILAKALNCEHGPTVTPCKRCESCRAIHDAVSIDVLELDAASHRGIDDIREIRDKVALRPARGRYKVYIVDEAHMLTKEASNAVLKTLEEPPEHVVFVLCTTELSAMLPTIRSRCQRFAFFRPSLAEIATVLRRIAEAEAVQVEDGALALIARSAGGSFRDAVSTLDQLATSQAGVIASADVLELLGRADDEVLFRALDAVANGDAAGALRLVDELVEGGTDLDGLTGDLLGHLRRLFLVHHLGELPAEEPVTADARARTEEQAARLGPAAAMRLVDLLREVTEEVREGADPRLPLEIALVKACRPETALSLTALEARVERLERGLPAAPSAPAVAAAAAVPPAAAGLSGEPGELERTWREAIVPEIGRRSRALEALVASAAPLEWQDGELVLGFPASKGFAKRGVEKPEHLDILRTVVSQAAGQEATVRLAVAGGEDEPTGEEPETLTEDELYARIKETFDAREVEESR